MLELVKGHDGQIRGAKLKVLFSKTGKQTAVFHPLQKLIPFEINKNHDCKGEQQPEESENVIDGDERMDVPAVTVDEENSDSFLVGERLVLLFKITTTCT